MFRKAFHILVAVFVAVPLGAGGLCCCLLGTHDREIEVAAEPAHSCCASEPAGAAAPAREPAGRPCADRGDDCGCPARDAAITKSASESQLPAPAPAAAAVPEPGEVALAPFAPAVERAVDHPPKRPLFRTLSVIRC
jgi:hypothetical protein